MRRPPGVCFRCAPAHPLYAGPSKAPHSFCRPVLIVVRLSHTHTLTRTDAPASSSNRLRRLQGRLPPIFNDDYATKRTSNARPHTFLGRSPLCGQPIYGSCAANERETRAIRTSVSEIIELAVVMLLVFFCGCCRLVGVPSSPVRAHAPCIIRRNGCTCSPRHIAVLRMQIANIKNAQRTTVCPVARRRRRTILLCAAEW